ncbi:MAG: RluA family pseudouridine synthase [Thermoguttaceae bacterium]|nr:RluA family pseudouridine synthase [Thermoguttaceae bacterium]MDW8079312.1 RluA family pseudouridine synthase [Thermoguttaceae bacterium]
MEHRYLSEQPVELRVGPAEVGWRLDQFLVYHFPQYTRAHLRRIITAGGVRVDDRGCKPAYRLKLGQRVSVVLPEIPRQSPKPENIPLEILYEDEWLAVINKPPGMVVHPSRGHWSGTIAGALVYHFGGRLSSLGGPTRPGVVHRLDRDTSGALLVAKHDLAHSQLARQFHDRVVEKEYFAIVVGTPDRDRDVISLPIGVHPHHREKMAIRTITPAGRMAETFYEVLERFDGFAALRVVPKTGRTHQIRVHLDHIGCPVLCDKQYGGRASISASEIRRQVPSPSEEPLLARQALHAWRLGFIHPGTEKWMKVEAPLPADILRVLEELRHYRSLGVKSPPS